MIAGLLAVFFLVGMQITVPNLEKWALAPSWSCVKMEPWPPMLTKNLVPNLEALMSFAGCCHVESIPGPTISPSFTISSQFFSIFHHSFRVFSHLSSSTICSWCPPIFMHFLAVFPGFSPPFIRNLPGWPLFFPPGARCFGLRQPGAVPRAGPGRAAQRDVGRRAAARVLHRGGRGARWGAEQCWAVLRGEGWCLRWHFSNWKIGIFPGSKADNYGKSPFSMGKSTINVPFSIAFCNRNLWDVMISPRSLPLEAMAPDEAFDDLWRFTYEKIQFSRVTLNYWRIHHFTKLVWWLKEGFKGEWWGLRGGFGDWFGIE